MREEGVVRSAERDRVVIEIHPPSPPMCAQCGEATHCSTMRPRLLHLPADVPLAPGDRVVVDQPTPPVAVSALALFVPPVGGLLLGYAAGSLLAAPLADALSPVIPRVALTALGFLAGLALLIALERRWRRRHPATVRPLADD